MFEIFELSIFVNANVMTDKATGQLIQEKPSIIIHINTMISIFAFSISNSNAIVNDYVEDDIILSLYKFKIMSRMLL
jgi:hypothetical protein